MTRPNREFRATNTSAILAGVWTLIGAYTTNAVLAAQNVNSDTRSLAWLAASVVFLFIPGFVFVFGIQHSEMRDRGTFSMPTLQQQGKIFRGMFVRGLWWLFGAVVGALLLGTLGAIAGLIVN